MDGVVAKDVLNAYKQNIGNNATISPSKGDNGLRADGFIANPLQLASQLNLDQIGDGSLHGSTHVAVNTDIPGKYSLGCGAGTRSIIEKTNEMYN